MHYLPVIDILDGSAVHARRGDRTRYQPLHSPLARTPAPLDVFAGYLSLYPFETCYIADLNSLLARGTSDHEIAIVVAQHPSVEFWIDAAFGARDLLPEYLQQSNVRCIIGSESLSALARYEALRTALAPYTEPVLSLDFRNREFLGPPALLATTACWPRHIIGMNLARVGSGEGPDLDLLQRLRGSAPTAAIAAAGGIRDAHDLATLSAHNISYALIATALHNGKLSADDLRRFASTEPVNP